MVIDKRGFGSQPALHRINSPPVLCYRHVAVDLVPEWAGRWRTNNPELAEKKTRQKRCFR
jgi:hypothetical protein